jgi:hypothetical protein
MRVNLVPEHPSVDPARIEAPVRQGMILLAKLILVCVAILAAGEMSWRLTGARPTRSDLLTFAQLRRASQNSANAVVLIGSSRALCDLDPRILKRDMPERNFYQLAIFGTSALPVLEAVAHDETFRGQVLCEFHVSYAVDEVPYPATDAIEATGRRYVHFIQQRPYLEFINAWFFEIMSQHSALVAAQEHDFPATMLGAFKNRVALIGRNRVEPLSSEHGALLPDAASREDRFMVLHRRGRSHESDNIATEVQIFKNRRKKDSAGVQQIAAWVEAIRRRGGDVIFIRLPVSGSLQRIEEETYPDQDRTFQSLAANKITFIDYAKEPTLSGFDCPDESHLDADDAERFSAALIRILKDRQLLKRGAAEIR